MSLIVSRESADRALGALRAEGLEPYIIGEIAEGGEKIELC